ncbi:C40 family peptidase [Kibdelosporangium persicum]|uniref:Secreted transglycosylase n=1 Tax=Kibdelosporangium persicum TaxID=2698649 RepID=A0ABX2F414_9PSEU|nr:C40 family peptidase [Kibdelosporangium persicum]NRN65735.1 Secreted transglycosylase [Kibdelosporangium persicum]
MILKVGAAALALILFIPLLIGNGVSGTISAVFGSSTSSLDCVLTGDTSARVAGYGPAQLANAATIVAVGRQMNVPEHGWLVALATAMQESTLNNLDHGDRDSLGLFQQRPSQGWGTPAQIMNPTYAATQFYQHLLAVPGWQQMSINDAAQAVQRSRTPSAYAKHEHTARAVLAAVHGATCTATTSEVVGTGDCNAIQAPNPATLAAINYACGQRGLPYVWGGDGPQEGGFDCSGLTKAAYAAAGITLPRTAHTQFHAGPRVPDGQPLLPGDLVFYGNPNTKIRHVGLYIGGGLMIDAPDRGQVVKIQPYRHRGDDYAGATRPAN